MARVGASFVHTPSSESMRGGGISPFAVAQRAGVNCALGTDGPMVDYSVDMVEQMKVCILMQHVRHLDPTRMPVERTLEMATINAAKALGLDTELGSLEPGKRADIAVFDLSRPYVGVLHRPLTSFITAGKGSDARAVLVDGKVVYRGGTFARLEEHQTVITRAESVGRRLLDAAGLSHRLSPAWRQ
jgi:5-methylthioadenosine/S-adenosylhomocysteine deaminase